MDDLLKDYGTNISTTVASRPRSILAIAIMLIIIVGGALYWWFRPRAVEVTVMGPYVLKGAGSGATKDSLVTVFNQAQIDSALGNNFTMSFFVYMEDVNRERIPIGGPKGDFRFKPFLNILGIGDVLLDPIHQMARVSVKPLIQSNVIAPGGIVSIDVENFMIARWNQVTITLEGRTVDVYLNGALANSALLTNLPILKPVGVIMETSPDFSGQAGLFQAWPRRLTSGEVARNYKRNVDTRNKPLIPDKGVSFSEIWKIFTKSLCDVGLCGLQVEITGLEHIDYEYA